MLAIESQSTNLASKPVRSLLKLRSKGIPKLRERGWVLNYSFVAGPRFLASLKGMSSLFFVHKLHCYFKACAKPLDLVIH